jgi:manganese oxidase
MTSTTSGWTRLWAAVAAALALFLVITFMVSTGDPETAPAAADAAGGEAEATTIAVTLEEFGISPAELNAPAGAPVTFEVTNEGAIPHDFAIEGVGETEMLSSGETGTLEVDGLDAGTYDVLCTVPGHDASGMVATLTVSDDGVEAAAAGAEPIDGNDDHAGMDSDMAAEDMAAKHDDLSAFPAETEGEGNQPLEPEVDEDGTKVFELTADEIDWETEPGDFREGMAFNGQIPGPRIDVDLGDDVRIVVNNELEVPTALHLHGLRLPADMDGVPGLTQDSILPGESFEYEFTVRNAGSHMYHSHFDSANQVPSGLLGAFIVHDEDEPEVDHDLVMILNDGPLGYTLNGKGFPATEPLVVDEDDTIRVRYMNEGLEIHPMHLHGIPQEVVARDGYPLDAPYTEDNVLVAPGDRVDVIIEADEVGAWAWHCHILSHAEGADGMFGMVTALIVEE